jgi:hypothetical protein
MFDLLQQLTVNSEKATFMLADGVHEVGHVALLLARGGNGMEHAQCP